jgi:hypothetical protein
MEKAKNQSVNSEVERIKASPQEAHQNMNDEPDLGLVNLSQKLQELAERPDCITFDLRDEACDDFKTMQENIDIVKAFLCEVYDVQKMFVNALRPSIEEIWRSLAPILARTVKRLEEAIQQSIVAIDWYKNNTDSDEYHPSPYEYLYEACSAVSEDDAYIWEQCVPYIEIIYLREQIEMRGGKVPVFNIKQPLIDAELTDTEEYILEALGGDTLRGAELLKRAGYDNSSHYRQILSNLRKRGIICRDIKGYSRRLIK